MKPELKSLLFLFITFTGLLLTSCDVDDPGPLREVEHEYTLVDFDRLEIGDAFHVEVEQSGFFSIKVRGDRRNIDDLSVRKEGSTLIVKYSKNRQRRHDTFIEITMPSLAAVNFSGGCDARVGGFQDREEFDVYLSGASTCQLDADAVYMSAVLSGASYLNVRGTGERLDADVSGASTLKAFNFPVSHVKARLSGSSHGEVTAHSQLDVAASGASHLIYRGNPTVTSDLSGASSIDRD